MNDYEKQLQQQVEDASRRVEQGIAAGKFQSSPEGKLIQDWINERVSQLVTKMTSGKPMDRDEYLAAHGAVKELQSFNGMLHTKKSNLASAQEELNGLNGQQQAAVEARSSIDFN